MGKVCLISSERTGIYGTLYAIYNLFVSLLSSTAVVPRKCLLIDIQINLQAAGKPKKIIEKSEIEDTAEKGAKLATGNYDTDNDSKRCYIHFNST